MAITNFTIAQQKQFVSTSHLVTKANGISTNTEITKTLYFELTLWSDPGINDIGKVWITNAHLRNDYKSITKLEEYKVFFVEFLENGVYNYWAIDLANYGQKVLFKLDQNSAIQTITMHRYATDGSSNVLKTIIYYLD